MKTRAYTVGSLIPGRIMVERPSESSSNPLPVEKIKSQPAPIIVEQNGNRFEIQPEKGNLLESALKQGKPIQYKCRKGTCGQCTVKVVQAQGLSAPNEQEHKKLKGQLANGYRLACQIAIL
nr:(2Fe-2S)-binding protein [Neobacillus sp. Marseille-Q6967]